MSETRYKLHWITAILSVLKSIKDMIVPILILVFANGLNDMGTGKWYFDYLNFIIFGVLFIGLLISGLIKWKRFVYWFEDNELRIEYGLFVKKKRYIPFDRIHSLDYTEGILHRLFKLVKVKVETAGGSALKSEAELTAITKEAANRIEIEIADAKRRKVVAANGAEEIDDVEEIVVESVAKPIFTMAGKDLLILATTSGGIGLILSGALIFLAQFGDLIPLGRVYEEVSGIIKYGLLFVAIIVFLGFLVVWGISVAMTFVSYYGFTVVVDKEDIIITRGLIEKKRATVPLNRVQSVIVVENPLRQLFGYANVVIDNAGGGLGEGARIKLFPLVKKKHLYGPLKEIFPNIVVEEPKIKLPIRGLRYYYRIDFFWMIPAVGALTYYFFPYGLFSLLIIPVIVLWGYWQHRSGAYEIFNNQLTMRFRGFSLQTAYMMKKRIQSMEIKQNYFHRKAGVATVSARIKSGMGLFNAQVSHMEEADADRIIGWYEPTRESQIPKESFMDEVSEIKKPEEYSP